MQWHDLGSLHYSHEPLCLAWFYILSKQNIESKSSLLKIWDFPVFIEVSHIFVDDVSSAFFSIGKYFYMKLTIKYTYEVQCLGHCVIHSDY